MTRLVKIVIALVVVAALGFGGFFVFEYFDHRGKVKEASRACGTLTTPEAGASIPAGLPFVLPSGQTLLKAQSQGKTAILTAKLDGGRKDLVHIRDAVVEAMKGQGYTATATDQEPTYEAEGKFGGKVAGTINVQPLCTGFDQVRYKFNQ